MHDTTIDSEFDSMLVDEKLDEAGAKKSDLVEKDAAMRDESSVFNFKGASEKCSQSESETENKVLNVDLNRVACSVVTDPYAKHSGSRIPFDLNADGVTSSVNQSSCKNLHRSDCGSTIGKDPLTLWKEMKENGFISASHGGLNGFISSSNGGLMLQGAIASSSHGGIPVPNQRVPRNKGGALRKKSDTERKEHPERCVDISAPSGLLTGLNLGIINHVRNKRQVHSIIEALVRSEKLDGDRKMKVEDAATNKTKRIATSPADAADDVDPLQLRKPTVTNSPNVSCVSLLSVKAANVAAEWLALLNQDIKGRLSALRKSRKRVRSAISTELPFLVSNGLSCEEDDASLHVGRWRNLFEQMESTLAEEERELECWLHDVRELQLHCDHGLQNSHLLGASECAAIWNERLAGSAGELAVRAAAASIYSTCTFLLSKENSSTFLPSH